MRSLALTFFFAVSARAFIPAGPQADVLLKHLPEARPFLSLMINETAKMDAEKQAASLVAKDFLMGTSNWEQSLAKMETAAPTTWAAMKPVYSLLKDKIEGLEEKEARTFVDEGLKRAKATMADMFINGNGGAGQKALKDTLSAFKGLPEAAQSELKKAFAFFFDTIADYEIDFNKIQL